jgi:mannan endo-1,4-beta-mannosidase
MKQNKEHGMNVIRVWAFNEEWCGVTGCFIYKDDNGKLAVNEKAMERLDQVLHYAALNNIKVVLVPVNFEDSFGGMHWWVNTFKGQGYPKEDFYRDSYIQDLFKQYLGILVNRVNAKNGRLYRTDPTIMAWDTMNEPHTTDGVDWTGTLAANFICSTSAYLKKHLNVLQMVTSGEEGYRTRGDQSGVFKGHEWIQNGLKGVDFESNTKCPHLDYMTVHLYPDNW